MSSESGLGVTMLNVSVREYRHEIWGRVCPALALRHDNDEEENLKATLREYLEVKGG